VVNVANVTVYTCAIDGLPR